MFFVGVFRKTSRVDTGGASSLPPVASEATSRSCGRRDTGAPEVGSRLPSYTYPDDSRSITFWMQLRMLPEIDPETSKIVSGDIHMDLETSRVIRSFDWKLPEMLLEIPRRMYGVFR